MGQYRSRTGSPPPLRDQLWDDLVLTMRGQHAGKHPFHRQDRGFLYDRSHNRLEPSQPCTRLHPPGYRRNRYYVSIHARRACSDRASHSGGFQGHAGRARRGEAPPRHRDLLLNSDATALAPCCSSRSGTTPGPMTRPNHCRTNSRLVLDCPKGLVFGERPRPAIGCKYAEQPSRAVAVPQSHYPRGAALPRDSSV